MRWLKNNGFNLSNDIFLAAAENGATLRVFKFLEKNAVWNVQVFNNAIKNCDLGVWEWLKSKGCPWDETTFDASAMRGIETKKWLKNNGCPYDTMFFSKAVKAKCSSEELQWLKDNGFPYEGQEGENSNEWSSVDQWSTADNQWGASDQTDSQWGASDQTDNQWGASDDQWDMN